MTDPKHRLAPKRTKPVDQNSQIVSKLRAFYSSVEEEPLPDVFLDLLEQLDSIEKARKA
nr:MULTISPECIES: NepR family anti-sigma factor [unclassified Rhizobium]